MSSEDRHPRDAARALLDDAARAERAMRDRVASAAEALFRRRGPPLSDLELTLALRMLEGLVETTERGLRALMLVDPALAAGPEFSESLASERVAIALPLLKGAGMLADPELIGIVLRRVDEYRLGSALRARGQPGGDALDALLDDADTGVAGLARAALAAESRRNDRLDDPMLAPADLPVELRHRLLWQVAAAIRAYGVAEHGLDPSLLDPLLATAVNDILAAHDEDERLESAVLQLARALAASSALNDGVLLEALSRGRLAFYAAALAARARVAYEPAWDAATGFDQAGHAVLLRAIDVHEEAAATLLSAMTDARGADEAGEHAAEVVQASRALDPEAARGATIVWRLDESYRATISRLAEARA